ncbi:hydroxyacylglutathione hydrolase [Peptococcaceae bacterium CEB3]|nr:hydroxyacylglutathione hydrolase [Peptococcaceae bacterium CEB3]
MEAVTDKIFKISVPLPDVGKVNIYFLEGDMPTLIDTGLCYPGVEQGIETGLRSVGRRLRDIRRIIITHGHVDHYGLLEHLRQINGADVFMSAPEKQNMLDFQQDLASDMVREHLATSGVPGKLSKHILQYLEILRGLGGEITPASQIGTLAPGSMIFAGFQNWHVQCCAGHSPAGLCLYDEGGLIFTGDHILSKISPNPDLDLTKQRTHQGGLREYVDSLSANLSLPIRLCLPGHGPLVYNYAERIRSILNGINVRRANILAMVGVRPKSTFEISEDLLSDLGRKLTAPQLWLAMKEVKAHLDILETDLCVEALPIAGVHNYRLRNPQVAPELRQ